MARHLVLDLETDSLDVESANVKVWGLLDLDQDHLKITTDRFEAQNFINQFDFIITYNGTEFDLPILEKRYGIKIDKNKHIDIFKIFKKRQAVLTAKPFSNFKLKTIVKELKIDEIGKGDIDYNIFKKNKWTKEEQQEILEYLEQDLRLTAKCWEYLKKKFEPFKEFMKKEDVLHYKHVNSSMGAYTYKVICNLCGLKEEYDFDTEKVDYEGAYVRKPIKEVVRGKVLCFDFASLYPMMYIHANLFSHSCTCCKPSEKWDGGERFNIKGSYCKKRQGPIEQMIKKFYLLRKEYKRNKDQREQVVKIIINSLYGVSGSPIFKSLYNLNTAQDCTSLGQQCIKFAIKKFEDNGFVALYSDTDSVYVEIPEGKTEDECMVLSKTIAKDLSHSFPFPWEEFDFKLECKIKFIAFFQDDGDEFIKKNYIYLTDEGKLVVKGLKIVKKDCSHLSKLIFVKYIKDNIKEKLVYKYPKEEIERFIKLELLNNIEVAAKQFSIKEKKAYKNATSIQAMIFEKYGVGEHQMIKNKKMGVGKGVKYCSLAEAKQLSLSDIDINVFLKELSYFIKKDSRTTLEAFI
jgi:DNA polymerase, archaea type